MKIIIRELREGSNPIRFEIPPTTMGEILQSMDELYRASEAGVVDLDVQKFNEIMHVRGSVAAPIAFECGRCLTPRERTVEIRLNWTLMPKDQLETPGVEEVELSTDDLDTSFYAGEEIDLLELAREAILLELDAIPRCGPDEACEADKFLAQPEEPEEERLDPRWGPLQAMLEKKNKQ